MPGSARVMVGRSAAILLAAFCLGHSSGALAQSAPAPSGPTVPVTAVAAQSADVPVLLRNIGIVQAYQSVLIRARVDGTLDKVLFTEGQDVKPGDKLVQIDPRPYADALAAAQAKKAADEASLANAERDMARYASLARSDFASRQQVDTQAATVSSLQATLKGDDAAIASAALNLSFTDISSPIEGRTGLRQVDAGNLIHANDLTGLVTITQIHPISVIFTLPQDTLPQVQSAMAQHPLQVLAFSSDDRTLLSTGQLLTVDNTIDQGTGTFKLKAAFANTDNHLWPGQFVNARLVVETLKNVVSVPSIAVQRGPNGLYVYTVKPDNTVAVQPVDVRQDDGTIAVIAKGLDAGTKVVTNGMSRLQAGTRVAVTDAKASG